MHYWITGASSGIGAALATQLAAQGHIVSISARSEADLIEVQKSATRSSGTINCYPLDVVDLEATKIQIAKMIAENGPIDVAILNAGIYVPVHAEDFRAAAFKKTFDINVLGVANGLEAVMFDMMKRRSGHIAITSSVTGYGGLPTSAAYGATKSALINMAESLKFDLDRYGVKLQIINPGFVETPATDVNPFPMPFLVTAQKAASQIIIGLEKKQFEITFPKRFTYLLKALNLLPYGAYFALVGRGTKWRSRPPEKIKD